MSEEPQADLSAVLRDRREKLGHTDESRQRLGHDAHADGEHHGQADGDRTLTRVRLVQLLERELRAIVACISSVISRSASSRVDEGSDRPALTTASRTATTARDTSA